MLLCVGEGVSVLSDCRISEVSTIELSLLLVLTTPTGLRLLKAQKDMSNGRGKSQYFPMFAYVAPVQMRRKGNLWPYSTRATEGRGARYKRIVRTTVCHRKPAARR